MPKFACTAILVVFTSLYSVADAKPLIESGDRVLCIGDSITAAGHYVSFLDMQLQVRDAVVECFECQFLLPNITGSSRPRT